MIAYNIVASVKIELSLCNAENEDVVNGLIETFVGSCDSCMNAVEAYRLISQSPYEWSELLPTSSIEQQYKACREDLGDLIVSVAEQIINLDVTSEICSSEAYRFITDGAKNIIEEIPHKSLIIYFQEKWLSSASGFDYLPAIEIFRIKDREVTLYSEGGELFLVMEHKDDSLVYVSERVVNTNKMDIGDFEALKCHTLLGYGYDEDNLWLSECTTVEGFRNFWGEEKTTDLGLDDYKFVVYNHESGSIGQIGGFNDYDEFQKACRFVATGSLHQK